ncbi:pentatricopeptide repeat-containing protein At2g13600 [Cryptomeria japonica]|uniref:pentatricopeptide repeat-containing protein At2g13600 n=1 Tax=Cryptomeria japonica TaxID=3369 RepID=UPI0025AD153D|nr:pentatricopeptide repeat-containing protein At2g13600 [Cryptomeria japonica]XP_057845675.1 pentatricopeptide repeat-containing protein At2g13600 [Cryptomeria japonica]XP_057845677.1 pentatricopeptide repeat-containing protein At2g13600 [Cryptomeria japonica]XP_057845678.1 pentatricopeptide repeat-containing protein At2g13600 [Cryptomeria japonica]XP_057845679.1 pentatricopeptide repeat-containing protein At2g13600 [Cryptomeria japonica]XP_057845680.1 pentatricopeptide repeat-containing prot
MRDKFFQSCSCYIQIQLGFTQVLNRRQPRVQVYLTNCSSNSGKIHTNFRTYAHLLQNSIPSRSLGSHTHFNANSYMSYLKRLIHYNGHATDARHMFDKTPQRDEVSYWNRLIQSCAKSGNLKTAHQLFDKMPTRNVVSWNAMISGYDQYGLKEKVLNLFCQMVHSGVKPDQFTFPSTLRSCGFLSALNPGKQLHGYIIRTGFESNAFVGSALIDLYAKCEKTGDARRVFDEMPERDTVLWTTMIGVYAQNQFAEESLKLFCKMQKEDMKQDSIILLTVLIACGSLAALAQGKMVHAQVIKAGFHTNYIVGNAIVDMYAKCAAMKDAHRMFDRMSERDVVSWTAMIVGYIQNGYCEEALKLFQKLLWTDVKPNRFTFASTLSACANLAMLELGKQLHAHIVGVGYESVLSVESSLISMYAKCGSIDDAALVFNQIASKDLISWNAMIAGYAINGNGKEAFQLFKLMIEADMNPDRITFLNVLSACSHAGLVNEGCLCFELMRREYINLVTTNHYACMIDLLGRAGQLSEAENIVNNMHIKPDALVWKALLHACRIHANVELGERAAEHLLQCEPEEPSNYVLLSNVYAAANRWPDAAKARKLMKDRGLKTQRGCSWIHVKNRLYAFVAENTSHPLSEEIYAMV